jgi:hypothetical protein
LITLIFFEWVLDVKSNWQPCRTGTAEDQQANNTITARWNHPLEQPAWSPGNQVT